MNTRIFDYTFLSGAKKVKSAFHPLRFMYNYFNYLQQDNLNIIKISGQKHPLNKQNTPLTK